MDTLLVNLFAYGWVGFLAALWIGLSVGSFLNVVIYRLPVMMQRRWETEAREILEVPGWIDEPETFNLATPPSHCPHCAHKIRPWQNIPVVSWLLLRGRCAGCKAAIAVRYPAVELLTGICTLIVLGSFGFTAFGLAACVFTWVLIAATFIDFDTQLLPDELTLPLLWLGLLVAIWGGLIDLQTAVVGAVAAYLFLWSVYWGFKLLTGKEGMGYGDFKLYAAIGAWLGWQVLPGVILMASLAGLIYALYGLLRGTREGGVPIAFGPFLAVGGWVALVMRDTVMHIFVR